MKRELEGDLGGLKVEVRVEGDVAMVRRWEAQMRREVLDIYM